jgi:hypothetical protein
MATAKAVWRTGTWDVRIPTSKSKRLRAYVGTDLPTLMRLVTTSSAQAGTLSLPPLRSAARGVLLRQSPSF